MVPAREAFDLLYHFIVQRAPTTDGLVRVRMFWTNGRQRNKNFAGTLDLTVESWASIQSRFPDAIIEQVEWFKGIG